MKRFLMLLSILFCCIASAATETINWYVDNNIYTTTTCTTGGDIILPTTPTKHGYDFTGWVSYTPIEYLESTGLQWIDTGFTSNNTSKIIIEIQIPSSYITSDQKLFGNGQNWRHTFSLNTLGGYYRETNIPVSTEKTLIQIYISEYSDRTELIAEYNNTTYEADKWWSMNTPTSDIFPIFGGVGCNKVCVSIYKCFFVKQYDLDSNLVRDMIPVIDQNGVPCMYDKVTQQFFYNQGTGSFIAGPSLLN